MAKPTSTSSRIQSNFLKQSGGKQGSEEKSTPKSQLQIKKNNYNIGKKTCHRNKITEMKNVQKTKKSTIPKKLREEIWNHYNTGVYSAKCYVPWCDRLIDVFNFHVGHDIPECKGGTDDIINLKPICSNCNLSMGYRFTITDWSKLKLKKKHILQHVDIYKLSFSIISMMSILLNFYQLRV